MNTEETHHSIANTAAAISSAVHGNDDKYNTLYGEIADHDAIGGFPGIWSYIASAALALEERGYDDDDWMDIVDSIGAEILKLTCDDPFLEHPGMLVQHVLAQFGKKKNKAGTQQVFGPFPGSKPPLAKPGYKHSEYVLARIKLRESDKHQWTVGYYHYDLPGGPTWIGPFGSMLQPDVWWDLSALDTNYETSS